MKKLLIFVLLLLIPFSNVYALPETDNNQHVVYEADMRWKGVVSVTYRLDEDPAGYASPFYTLIVEPGKVDNADITTTLQRYNGTSWVDVTSWTQNIKLKEVTNYYEEYKVSEKNYTYRFSFSIIAKKGSTVVDSISGVSKSRVI